MKRCRKQSSKMSSPYCCAPVRAGRPKTLLGSLSAEHPQEGIVWWAGNAQMRNELGNVYLQLGSLGSARESYEVSSGQHNRCFGPLHTPWSKGWNMSPALKLHEPMVFVAGSVAFRKRAGMIQVTHKVSTGQLRSSFRTGLLILSITFRL